MESYPRITAFASWQAGPGGCRPSSLLWTLLLVFAPAQLPAETTLYVGKHFEVREHDAPVKYVFNDSTRVARVTGSLSANERIQRLRLRAGWNLVSLAVTAPDLLGQLQEFTSGPAPVIQALYRWQPATKNHGTIASGESVVVGTVLWVSARTNAVVAVRGGYVEPSQWSAPGGETFVAVPALEAQPLTVPAGVTIWRYDTESGRWQAGLTGDLASLSDVPPTLAPGEAIYVHSHEPTNLGAPAREERIRFYHPDHLGSSSVMTDADGAILEETAFYPFGAARNEHKVRSTEEPYKFTQKERDRESGLDYFEARYLAGFMSRFLSVDPMYANTDSSVDDPQALNLYAYVRNNPLLYTDPTGLDQYSDIANAAAMSDTKAAEADGGFTMGILRDAVTFTTGFCDHALGCGMGGYQVMREINVKGYNVDTDSTLYKGAAVAGTIATAFIPSPVKATPAAPGTVTLFSKTPAAPVLAGGGGTLSTSAGSMAGRPAVGPGGNTGASAPANGLMARAGAERTASGGASNSTVPSALADTLPGATAQMGGLSRSQTEWIQRVAKSTGLAEARMAAHAAGDKAAIDRIASCWDALFRNAKYVK